MTPGALDGQEQGPEQRGRCRKGFKHDYSKKFNKSIYDSILMYFTE